MESALIEATGALPLETANDTPVIELESPPTATRSAIPTLRNNFAWTFAGSVLYGACQWGMLSAIAKMGSPSIVGQFTLGLAIGAPVFMFTNLQLRAVQATDVNVEHSSPTTSRFDCWQRCSA